MRSIPVLIEFDPDTKTYGATSPVLPDVFAISESRDDVLERFVNSANSYLTFLRERGEDLPSLSSSHEVVTVAIEAA